MIKAGHALVMGEGCIEFVEIVGKFHVVYDTILVFRNTINFRML